MMIATSMFWAWAPHKRERSQSLEAKSGVCKWLCAAVGRALLSESWKGWSMITDHDDNVVMVDMWRIVYHLNHAYNGPKNLGKDNLQNFQAYNLNFTFIYFVILNNFIFSKEIIGDMCHRKEMKRVFLLIFIKLSLPAPLCLSWRSKDWTTNQLSSNKQPDDEIN